MKQTTKTQLMQKKFCALINVLRNNHYDADVNNQPTESYWNKQKDKKDMYLENPKAFMQYSTLVKDILYLYDYINFKTQELWPNKRGSLNSLGLTTKYKQKDYHFQILDKKLDYKLHDAVFYILLSGLDHLLYLIQILLLGGQKILTKCYDYTILWF